MTVAIFYYGEPDRAAAANQVIADGRADRQARRPAVRRARPTCARRRTATRTSTTCSRELDPATYYIEMDPGVANAEGSRLAQDLESADIAILSSIWDDWGEPNDSRKTGSDEAERVLERDFCLVGNYLDRYELYRRCN